MQHRKIFFVSDRTGITVETLAHSLLTQFEGISFERHSFPFIDTDEKLDVVISRIEAVSREEMRPLIFCSLVDGVARSRLEQSSGMVIDLFDAFILPLEDELGVRSIHAIGRAHGDIDNAYHARMDAVNFALNNDDGASTHHYPHADIILTGVSRSGKTPTCIYLAMQYGILAANYPLVDDDLNREQLPRELAPFRSKLFGLTIKPSRLAAIRSERRLDSIYASFAQCESEVHAAEAIFVHEGIPLLDSTSMSVEEIATTIMDRTAIKRRWMI